MKLTDRQRREINEMFDGVDLTQTTFRNPWLRAEAASVRLCPLCGKRTSMKPSLNANAAYERCECGYRGMVLAPEEVKVKNMMLIR